MPRILILIAACLFVIAATTPVSCQADGSPDAAPGTLTIHLVNEANVPQNIVANAKLHVVRIFGHAGIHVVWNGTDGLELAVILVPAADETLFDGNNPNVNGLALGNNGEGIRRAYILPDRIKQQSWSLLQSAVSNRVLRETPAMLDRKDIEALILGHVIAHEIGHLMLPPRAHTLNGIMSPYIERGEILRALDGHLLFLPEQSESMLRVLRRAR